VRALDVCLVVLALAFAFLVASFRAANSDLFLHLATGRLIAHGAFAFGSDPFTFTSAAWVNHNWLYDLAVYLLYSLPEGGVVLVVVKALLAALLAWLLYRAGSSAGQPGWIPVCCATLAVLASSPRFHVQPLVPSCVLLAAFLLLLRRGAASRTLWLLPLLCALWVNLDEWFVLGPLAVALWLAGEWVQRRIEPALAAPPGTLGKLALVLVASLAACLLNPYHVRAFALPTVLDPRIALDARTREQFLGLFLSPLERPYFSTTLGLSVAGCAFFLLAGLGVASFVAAYDRGADGRGIGWRWPRVFVWLVFLLLGFANWRAVPLFAVATAPLVSLNFLDYARRQVGAAGFTDPGWQRWALSGRAFTVVLLLAAGAACVPGWLQAEPHYARRLGWGVVVEEGMRDAALQVKRWREDKLIGADDRWFNTSPELVAYLAWFCADEQGRPLAPAFLDFRLPLFAAALPDYVTVQRALAGKDLPQETADGRPAPPAWREVLARRGVRLLAFHSQEYLPNSPTLARLYGRPREWMPCYRKGRTALFAWRDPESGPPFDRRLGLDFDRLAFGPDAVTAPDSPGRAPGDLPWWRVLLDPDRPVALAAGTAAQDRVRFNSLTSRYRLDIQTRWQAALAARMVGAGVSRAGPVANGELPLLRLALSYMDRAPGEQMTRTDADAMKLFSSFYGMQDQGPPASLYLAIREARQALAKNPEDAQSHLLLAQSYLTLSQATGERVCFANGLLPQVDLVRRSQAAGALVTLLELKPAPEVAMMAHYLLAEAVFTPERPGAPDNYLEPRVAHFRAYAQLLKARTPPPGVPSEQFAKEVERVERRLKELVQALKNKKDQYLVNAGTKPTLVKARLALDNGLAETGLNLLLDAVKNDPKSLHDQRNPNDRPGPTLIIQLLLGLGRLGDARQALESVGEKEEQKAGLGMHPMLRIPAYPWLVAQLAAASGDYAAADEALADCIAAVRKNPAAFLYLAAMDVLPPGYRNNRPADVREFAGLMVGDILLRNASQAAGAWQILPHVPKRLHKPAGLKQPGWQASLMQGRQYLFLVHEQMADLYSLRAWLALEQGRTGHARKCLAEAFALGDLGQVAPGFHQLLPFRARQLAHTCAELLALPGRSRP
jgi:hypothetical protein